jgi:hypothetical protein
VNAISHTSILFAPPPIGSVFLSKSKPLRLLATRLVVRLLGLAGLERRERHGCAGKRADLVSDPLLKVRLDDIPVTVDKLERASLVCHLRDEASVDARQGPIHLALGTDKGTILLCALHIGAKLPALSRGETAGNAQFCVNCLG